jgi:NDP-sugar pyrophosphorylase family protein
MYSIAILCGGFGTRLYPVTKYLPKSLYPINGKPFIDYQLERLKSTGFNHVVLLVSNFGNEIREYVGNGKRYGLNIEYSFDNATGTFPAIKKAFKFLDHNSFLMYGDSYLTADFQDIQKTYDEQNKHLLITIYKNDDEGLHKNNVTYIDSQIIDYSQHNLNNSCEYVEYGITIFNKNYLDKFDETCYTNISNLYNFVIAENNLASYIVKNRFYEVGSLRGIQDFTKYVIGKGL